MEKLLTMDELAEILSVKRSTIYRWTHLKLIPYVKVGRLNRFREKDIQKWLKSREAKSNSRYISLC